MDLLAALLQKDPTARPSAADALQHPWLNGSASAGVHPLAPSIVQGLVRHQMATGLQRAALKIVAPLLGGDAAGRVSEARQCFETMDTNKDGYISIEEFFDNDEDAREELAKSKYLKFVYGMSKWRREQLEDTREIRQAVNRYGIYSSPEPNLTEEQAF